MSAPERTCCSVVEFEAGYAGKGIMRGRLAVPVKAKDGKLLVYVGIAVDREQSPQNFPAESFRRQHGASQG